MHLFVVVKFLWLCFLLWSAFKMDFDRCFDLIKQKYLLPSNFKPQQKDAIVRVIQRQNVVVVWPTGFGKSLTYLVPPLLLDEVDQCMVL